MNTGRGHIVSLGHYFTFLSPALSAYACSFERDLCGWMRGAEEEQDWQVMSGPTDTPNTGPAGDHTTTTGQSIPQLHHITTQCTHFMIMYIKTHPVFIFYFIAT